jgi:hypothetical protein
MVFCALHGHETWSVILREEYDFMMFKNRLLGRILGPKEVNKKIIKSRKVEWVGHAAHFA